MSFDLFPSYVLKALGVVLIFAAAMMASPDEKALTAGAAYFAVTIAWWISTRNAERWLKLWLGSDRCALLMRQRSDAARIATLEEAVEEAMLHFKSEWDAVGNHPASRFRYDYIHYKAVLQGIKESEDE